MEAVEHETFIPSAEVHDDDRTSTWGELQTSSNNSVHWWVGALETPRKNFEIPMGLYFHQLGHDDDRIDLMKKR
jgi:hypothetical protein